MPEVPLRTGAVLHIDLDNREDDGIRRTYGGAVRQLLPSLATLGSQIE